VQIHPRKGPLDREEVKVRAVILELHITFDARRSI
jgi:hypothetical protein